MIFCCEEHDRLFFFTSSGDPAMLHHLIMKEELQISNLKEMNQETLRRVCKECEIKTSGKSVVIYTLHL